MELRERYRPYIIKEYEYWTLVLHEKQLPYIGRCYAWWKDRAPGEGEGMPPSSLPPRGIIEATRKIFVDVQTACTKLGYDSLGPGAYGKKFLLNTCYLANEPAHNHHMHIHYIPRSAHRVVVEALGLASEDIEWGRNYAKPMQGEHTLPRRVLLEIRDIVANAIG